MSTAGRTSTTGVIYIAGAGVVESYSTGLPSTTRTTAALGTILLPGGRLYNNKLQARIPSWDSDGDSISGTMVYSITSVGVAR